MPMHDMLKKKMQIKSKVKRIKMLLNMVESVFLGDVRGYKMYVKGDSSHEAVMIVCECM